MRMLIDFKGKIDILIRRVPTFNNLVCTFSILYNDVMYIDYVIDDGVDVHQSFNLIRNIFTIYINDYWFLYSSLEMSVNNVTIAATKRRVWHRQPAVITLPLQQLHGGYGADSLPS